MKFSERMGIIKAKNIVQLEKMDNELRNGLWNGFKIHYLDKFNEYLIKETKYEKFLKTLWMDFFKFSLSTLPEQTYDVKNNLQRWFSQWKWYEVYDFIEAVSNTKSPNNSNSFRKFCNGVLEKEMSGYRFVNKKIAPITNDSEISEIDLAIETSETASLIGVKTHLESALKKLADRDNPDYRNSIKESISAVEAIAKAISNNERDSLGGALDKIKGKINLHPALERGFKQIYGYTSDADGIRHALTEKSECDFEDAKYMLVASSAFVNYLIVKAEKARITV